MWPAFLKSELDKLLAVHLQLDIYYFIFGEKGRNLFLFKSLTWWVVVQNSITHTYLQDERPEQLLYMWE